MLPGHACSLRERLQCRGHTAYWKFPPRQRPLGVRRARRAQTCQEPPLRELTVRENKGGEEDDSAGTAADPTQQTCTRALHPGVDGGALGISPPGPSSPRASVYPNAARQISNGARENAASSGGKRGTRSAMKRHRASSYVPRFQVHAETGRGGRIRFLQLPYQIATILTAHNGGQNSETGPLGAEIKYQRGRVPSGGSGENLPPYHITLALPPPLPKDLCGHVGPSRQPLPHLGILNLTTNAKPLWLHQVSQQRVPGTGVWASLGALILLPTPGEHSTPGGRTTKGWLCRPGTQEGRNSRNKGRRTVHTRDKRQPPDRACLAPRSCSS